MNKLHALLQKTNSRHSVSVSIETSVNIRDKNANSEENIKVYVCVCVVKDIERMWLVIVLTTLVYEVLVGKCPGQAYSTPFNTSSSVLTEQLNVVWSIYGNCEEKLDTNDNGFSDNPTWAEWDALKFSWHNRNAYRDHAKSTLFRFPINEINGTKGEMSDGFVWS